ncbi:MAG: hypothetical protein R3F43_01265 [bacterium]
MAGALVINENGEWVGNPTGLVSPPGPPGPAGDVDVDEIVNNMLAILAANPGRLPYLSSNADDTAEGNTITVDGGRLVSAPGPSPTRRSWATTSSASTPCASTTRATTRASSGMARAPASPWPP